MMRVIKGIMATMARLVNSWVPIRSRLALSKRASSKASRLKARTGMMPVRISRLTRFSRSTSVCMLLELRHGHVHQDGDEQQQRGHRQHR